MKNLLAFCALFLLIACGADQPEATVAATKTPETKPKEKTEVKVLPPAADYSGEWNYMVTEIPDTEDAKGVMKITQSGDKIEGVVITNGNETKMKNLIISGNELTSTVNVDGNDLKIKGSFEQNSFQGTVGAQGYNFPMTAFKK